MIRYDVKILGTYDYQFTTTSKDDVVTILQAIVDQLIENGYRRNEIDFDPDAMYSSWWLIDENPQAMFDGIYVQLDTTEIDIDEIVRSVV